MSPEISLRCFTASVGQTVEIQQHFIRLFKARQPVAETVYISNSLQEVNQCQSQPQLLESIFSHFYSDAQVVQSNCININNNLNLSCKA